MNEDEDDTKDYTPQELADQYAAHDAKLRTLITVEGGYIVFPQEENYDIALAKLDSPASVLRWVWHLGQKAWMTQDVLLRFIEIASAHHRFDLTEPAVRRP